MTIDDFRSKINLKSPFQSRK